ncbi:MAG: DUF1566 domain-containing protein [Candidatus Pacebacteria bacterium]|nr:DUF1566 domain-containing protein [Candidatus Paceibacterota bacterium]
MNLKSKKGFFSFSNLTWIIVISAVLLATVFYYNSKIKKIEKKQAEENVSAEKVTQVSQENSGQIFDDRSVNEINSSIWKDVGGSPFKNYKEIKYTTEGKIIGLYSGETKFDELSGLVWSAPSNFPLSNQFTINKEGKISGGAANGFCAELNKIEYAGFDNWRLPTQKELMQGYIDGASSSLIDRPYYFWSGTEFFGDATRAWRMNLRAGDMLSSLKKENLTNSVICVAETR